MISGEYEKLALAMKPNPQLALRVIIYISILMPDGPGGPGTLIIRSAADND